MFNFETPYLDMYKTQHFKFKDKPTVLHRKTCPVCGRNLVNLYHSNRPPERVDYICKKCIDKLPEEKGGADNG